MYKSDLFKNKSILVTGGRSGIGFGIAKQFLQLGAKVCICSRKEEKLKIAAEELNAFGEVIFQACDIRKTDELENLAVFIKSEFGKLDILVNNAGGQFPALAEHISENGWNAVINTNLNGSFYASKIMAEQFFIPQNFGNIINIVAITNRGIPGMAHTSAARAGVENLTKTLAQEWAHFNIRVNAVAPGIIESDGLDTYMDAVKEVLLDYKNENLMGRLGRVEDVANAVSFLASDLSSYISGTCIYVDGMDHLHGNRMAMIDKVMGRKKNN